MYKFFTRILCALCLVTSVSYGQSPTAIRTQLQNFRNPYNNTTITAKTGANSITPINVGGNIDSTCRYIDSCLKYLSALGSGDLQAVTDIGNVTTNPMYSGNISGLYGFMSDQDLALYRNSNNLIGLRMEVTGPNGRGFLNLQDETSGLVNGLTSNPDLTSDWIVMLPDEGDGVGLDATLVTHTTKDAITVTGGGNTAIVDKTEIDIAASGNISSMQPTEYFIKDGSNQKLVDLLNSSGEGLAYFRDAAGRKVAQIGSFSGDGGAAFGRLDSLGGTLVRNQYSSMDSSTIGFLNNHTNGVYLAANRASILAAASPFVQTLQVRTGTIANIDQITANVDSSIYSTKAWRQKGIDSVAAALMASGTLQAVATAGNWTNKSLTVYQRGIGLDVQYDSTSGMDCQVNYGGIHTSDATTSPTTQSYLNASSIQFLQAGQSLTLVIATLSGAAKTITVPNESGTLLTSAGISWGDLTANGTGVATSFTFTIASGYTDAIIQSKNLVATVQSSSISGTTLTVNCIAAPVLGTGNVLFTYQLLR